MFFSREWEHFCHNFTQGRSGSLLNSVLFCDWNVSSQTMWISCTHFLKCFLLCWQNKNATLWYCEWTVCFGEEHRKDEGTCDNVYSVSFSCSMSILHGQYLRERSFISIVFWWPKEGMLRNYTSFLRRLFQSERLVVKTVTHDENVGKYFYETGKKFFFVESVAGVTEIREGWRWMLHSRSRLKDFPVDDGASYAPSWWATLWWLMLRSASPPQAAGNATPVWLFWSDVTADMCSFQRRENRGGKISITSKLRRKTDRHNSFSELFSIICCQL